MELFGRRATVILRALRKSTLKRLDEQDTGALEKAFTVIAEGGVVAHATEGVWGLSCDPEVPGAVTRVLEIKARDQKKGFILIGGSADAFAPELSALSEAQCAAIAQTWPGAHTWILPNVRFSAAITGGRETIACRVPGHEQARALAAMFGRPIVSTSANRSGEAAATTESQVQALFGSEVDYVVSGQVLRPGVPSAIHTLDGARLR